MSELAITVATVKLQVTLDSCLNGSFISFISCFDYEMYFAKSTDISPKIV